MLDLIDNGNAQSSTDAAISNGLALSFSKLHLLEAFGSATSYKHTMDNNEEMHKQQVSKFCVNENAQYKPMLDIFMKSNNTKQITGDIACLEFALSLLKERINYKNDLCNAYYEKVNVALKHINTVLK